MLFLIPDILPALINSLYSLTSTMEKSTSSASIYSVSSLIDSDSMASAKTQSVNDTKAAMLANYSTDVMSQPHDTHYLAVIKNSAGKTISSKTFKADEYEKGKLYCAAAVKRRGGNEADLMTIHTAKPAANAAGKAT